MYEINLDLSIIILRVRIFFHWATGKVFWYLSHLKLNFVEAT